MSSFSLHSKKKEKVFFYKKNVYQYENIIATLQGVMGRQWFSSKESKKRKSKSGSSRSIRHHENWALFSCQLAFCYESEKRRKNLNFYEIRKKRIITWKKLKGMLWQGRFFTWEKVKLLNFKFFFLTFSTVEIWNISLTFEFSFFIHSYSYRK